MKAVLRGKRTALNEYFRKEESSKINNPSFYLRKLENEEQTRSKVSRRKETESEQKSMKLEVRNQ